MAFRSWDAVAPPAKHEGHEGCMSGYKLGPYPFCFCYSRAIGNLIVAAQDPIVWIIPDDLFAKIGCMHLCAGHH